MSEILGDSGEYEMLTKAVELSKDVDGLCVELGLRLGMGTKTIIDAIAEYCPHKVAMAIDPYGSIIYEHREGQFCRLDYTEQMKNTCLGNMYPYATDKKVKFRFWELEDTEFFKRFKDGVPIYDLEKKIVNQYAMAHLDAPHGGEAIIAEIDFFKDRMDSGACIVIDDISPDFVDLEPVEKYLFHWGFELIDKGNKKALYQKK